MLLCPPFRDLGRLPTPPPATTTTTASSRSHARGRAGARDEVCGTLYTWAPRGPSPEGIAVSATAARDVPASHPVRSASARPVANACTTSPVANTRSAGPITHSGSSGAIAGQIATLSAHLLPGASLAIGKRVSSSRTAKLVCGTSVSIRGAAAMLRIVLLARISTASAPAAWLLRWPVSAPYVVAVATTNIRVPVEIVVVIDVDVVVAAPAPAPAAAPGRPHHHANAKRNRQSRSVVSRRRIVNGRVGIHRRAVHHDRIIRRYIHDLWIGLFDHDHTLVLDDFGFYLLLLGRFQIASVLCLFAHALHGIHHIALLRQEGIAQIRGPLNVVCQALYDIGQRGQSLDAWIPGLFHDGIGECLILQTGILCQPLLELDEVQRICGGRKGLG